MLLRYAYLLLALLFLSCHLHASLASSIPSSQLDSHPNRPQAQTLSWKHSLHQWLHWARGDKYNPTVTTTESGPTQPSNSVTTSRLSDSQSSNVPPTSSRRVKTETHAQLPSYIQGASHSNNTSDFPIDYSLQMMHRAEVDLIASYLRPGDIYLEYGAGGSTINFAPLVARTYSVEHNCDWANHISQSIEDRASLYRRAYKNLTLKCVPMVPGFRGWGTLSNFEHANYQQFREYVDAIDTFQEPTFDRIFIDGRARLGCALKVLPYLNSNSLVFIHDFFSRTEQYSAALKYYDEVARVLAYRNTDETLGPIDEPQGLIVLKPSSSERVQLTTQEIDDIYNSIDWRKPFGPPLTSVHGYLHHFLSLFDIGRWRRARSPRALSSLVKGDMIRIMFSYIFISLLVVILRNYSFLGNLINSNDKKSLSKSQLLSSLNCLPSSSSSSSLTHSTTVKKRSPNRSPGPQYIETEAMKAANARRKSVASMSKLTLQ